jgi:hypothetical protein
MNLPAHPAGALKTGIVVAVAFPAGGSEAVRCSGHVGATFGASAVSYLTVFCEGAVRWRTATSFPPVRRES